jgi:hypothetical protein
MLPSFLTHVDHLDITALDHGREQAAVGGGRVDTLEVLAVQGAVAPLVEGLASTWGMGPERSFF